MREKEDIFTWERYYRRYGEDIENWKRRYGEDIENWKRRYGKDKSKDGENGLTSHRVRILTTICARYLMPQENGEIYESSSYLIL